MATTFYKLNSPNDVLSTDIVVIVETSNSLACRTDARSTSTGEANLPKGDSVSITTLANGVKTIEIDETTQDYLLVKVVKNGTYFNFYPYDDTNLEYELGCNSTNTNLRWKSNRGTSYKYDWSIYEDTSNDNNSFTITTTSGSSSTVKVMGYYHSNSAGETFRVNTAPSSGFANQKVELFVNRVILPKLEAPSITNNGNSFIDNYLTVTISNSNSAGDIYYTTDGTTPTTSSTLYNGSFVVNKPTDPGSPTAYETLTITAKCFASGYEDSDASSYELYFYYVREISNIYNSIGIDFVIQGIITYVDSTNYQFFIEDSTGGLRYSCNSTLWNAISQYVVLGNEIKIYCRLTQSLSSSKNYVNFKDSSHGDDIYLISSGNTLPITTTTISNITGGNTTSIRVKLQDIVMLNTSESTTGIYDNDDDSMMYIYNMPAKQGLKVGDNVDVVGVVFSDTNLNVQSANDITINSAPSGGGTVVKYQVNGQTITLDNLIVIKST